MLLQEDLYGWLAVGHDRGNPGEMISENRREKRREESKKTRDKASENMVTFTLILGVRWLEEYVGHYSTGSWRLVP